MYKTLIRISKISAGLALIYGPFLAIYQIHKTWSEKQYKTTVDLVDKFYEGDLKKARDAIRETISKEEEQIFNKNDAGKPAAEIFVELFKDNDLTKHQLQIIGYFDRLNNCIAVRMCDKNVIIDLLGEDIKKNVFYSRVLFGNRKEARGNFLAGSLNLDRLVRESQSGTSIASIAPK